MPTFTPTPISLATNVPNPFRGMVSFVEWDNSERSYRLNYGYQPSNYYARYYWRQIETSLGVYDWTLPDALIAMAEAQNGIAGIRIMALNSFPDGFGQSGIPTYLENLMPNRWLDYSSDPGGRLVPDWNDPDYLNRVQALNVAFANRYKNGGRLGYVDLFSYGDFGEWHLSGLQYPSPTGAVAGTNATINRIIDDAKAAWAGGLTRLCINLQSTVEQSNIRALEGEPTIGWRCDSAGACDDAGEGTGVPYSDVVATRAFAGITNLSTRWQTAPVFAEPRLNDAFSCMDDAKFLEEITTYHHSLVEPPQEGANRAAGSDWDQAHKICGYRVALTSAVLPSSITQAAPFNLESNWQNEGSAPAYFPHDTLWQLRTPGTTTVIWESPASNFQVEGFDPGTTQVDDTLTVPIGVAVGTYDLAVIMENPNGYPGPLRLAQQGRASDGAYVLGQISVAASGGGSTQTFTPSIIALSAAEIPNPMRGLVDMRDPYGNTMQTAYTPPGLVSSCMNVYQRLYWRQVETSQGVYDYSGFDAALDLAESLGGIAGIRVMPTGPSDDGYGQANNGLYVPDYLVSLMPLGWQDYSFHPWGDYIPDWNNANYLDRCQALNNALAARYKNDPRLGYVDYQPYGNWGEFHISYTGYPSPTGAVAGTQATLNRIVDDCWAAWSGGTALLIIRTQSTYQEQTGRALDKSTAVGWRDDGIAMIYDSGEGTGDPYPETVWNRNAAGYAPFATRWQTAPALGEPTSGSDVYAPDGDAFARQVGLFNLSLMEQFLVPVNTGTGDGSLVDQTFKSTGFRLTLDSVTVPVTITRGAPFSLDTTWQNRGIAPCYFVHDTIWQLRSGSTVVWESGAGTFQAKEFLPGSGVAFSDTLTVSIGVAVGTYDLAVVLRNPNGYPGPLRLAINGRQADGAYVLGQVSVEAAGGSPTPISPVQRITLQRTAFGDLVTGQFPSPPTIGNFVVVQAWNWSDTQNQGLAPNAATDNRGNTYSAVFSELGDGAAGDWVSAGIWYALVTTSAAPFIVTVDAEGTGNYVMLTATEYAGVATTSPLEASASMRSGTDGNINPRRSGAISVSAGSLLVAVMVQSPSPGTIAVNGGWTQLAEEPDSAAYIAGEADEQIVSATGSYEAQWSVGTAGNGWIGAIAAFRAATGATERSVPLTIALRQTRGRPAPLTIALRRFATRPVPLTMALRQARTRAVLLTIATRAAATRSAPFTIATSRVASRSAPLTIALSQVASRPAPLTIATSRVASRAVPLTISTTSSPNRPIPLTIATRAPENCVVPLTIALSRASSRAIPLAIATLRAATRTFALTIATRGTGTCAVPLTIAVASGTVTPITGTLVKGPRHTGTLVKGPRYTGTLEKPPWRQ